MNHLSEEDLIDLYYGESSAQSAAEAHLRTCRACSGNYERLKQDLDGVEPEPVPRRDTNYGWRVWQVLRPSLSVYEQRKQGSLRGMGLRHAAVAAGCALLVIAGFLGGRLWERHSSKPETVAKSTKSDSASPVILVVLTDHFDRTERLLVALQHASPKDKIENEQLQSEARDLLASNQLYRASASQISNPAIVTTLNQLEPLLAEVANGPNGLSVADLRRLREQMNSDGILFEIRVLLSRPPDQIGGTGQGKGASIS